MRDKQIFFKKKKKSGTENPIKNSNQVCISVCLNTCCKENSGSREFSDLKELDLRKEKLGHRHKAGSNLLLMIKMWNINLHYQKD